MDLSVLLRHYKRKEVQDLLIDHAQDKEVAVRYGEGFGKRPDVLQYPNDILEFVMKRASSFHASEELWFNPLQLNTGMKRNEIDDLRKGWDLVLDVDSKFFEYSRITANLIVQALQHHDVKSLSVKFSGNNGFHIGVPFEAFPDKVHDTETRLLFPEGPKRIAIYLKQMIKPHLKNALLTFHDLNTIRKNMGEDMKDGEEFNPFDVVDIDTVLISSRHLYRMPYSFNEKSGLVSVPILPDQILSFKREDATWDKINVGLKFIDRSIAEPNEARRLFVQAFDCTIEEENFDKLEIKDFKGSEEAIPEEYFPPCIKNILKGLKDGKKRSLFILTNFLTCVGWKHDDIKTFLKEWNGRNEEVLKEGLIESHLSYHKRNKKIILPPNCDNKSYYKGFQVCTPDNFCPKIKNPANYALLKQKVMSEHGKNKKVNKKNKKPAGNS